MLVYPLRVALRGACGSRSVRPGRRPTFGAVSFYALPFMACEPPLFAPRVCRRSPVAGQNDAVVREARVCANRFGRTDAGQQRLRKPPEKGAPHLHSGQALRVARCGDGLGRHPVRCSLGLRRGDLQGIDSVRKGGACRWPRARFGRERGAGGLGGLLPLTKTVMAAESSACISRRRWFRRTRTASRPRSSSSPSMASVAIPGSRLTPSGVARRRRDAGVGRAGVRLCRQIPEAVGSYSWLSW